MLKKDAHSGRGPLISWDIYMTFFHKLLGEADRLHILETLNMYKEKYRWIFDIEDVLDNATYEAVVLTDSKQQIQWVSDGFKKMTGYPFSFAKNKTPRFLQGEKTSTEVRARIRQHIQKGVSFKEQIINYRKNGEKYTCAIEVYPIKNIDEELTHFIAFEKETKLRA